MRTALTNYLRRCAFCMAIDKHNEAVHALKECPQMRPEFGDYAGFKRSIKYAKHHGGVCFRCHVPQCNDELHATFIKGGDDACDFPDVVVPVVWSVFREASGWAAAEVKFGKRWADWNDLADWLNGQPVRGHKTNLTAVFAWHYELQQQEQ